MFLLINSLHTPLAKFASVLDDLPGSKKTESAELRDQAKIPISNVVSVEGDV